MKLIEYLHLEQNGQADEDGYVELYNYVIPHETTTYKYVQNTSIRDVRFLKDGIVTHYRLGRCFQIGCTININGQDVKAKFLLKDENLLNLLSNDIVIRDGVLSGSYCFLLTDKKFIELVREDMDYEPYRLAYEQQQSNIRAEQLESQFKIRKNKLSIGTVYETSEGKELLYLGHYYLTDLNKREYNNRYVEQILYVDMETLDHTVYSDLTREIFTPETFYKYLIAYGHLINFERAKKLSFIGVSYEIINNLDKDQLVKSIYSSIEQSIYEDLNILLEETISKFNFFKEGNLFKGSDQYSFKLTDLYSNLSRFYGDDELVNSSFYMETTLKTESRRAYHLLSLIYTEYYKLMKWNQIFKTKEDIANNFQKNSLFMIMGFVKYLCYVDDNMLIYLATYRVELDNKELVNSKVIVSNKIGSTIGFIDEVINSPSKTSVSELVELSTQITTEFGVVSKVKISSEDEYHRNFVQNSRILRMSLGNAYYNGELYIGEISDVLNHIYRL